MMSGEWTNRAEPTLAPPRREPEGKPLPCDTKTQPVAAGSCNGTRSEPDRGQGAKGETTPQKAARIRLDVPMGTSYMEIQENIFRQVWHLAGTQLRAAITLGIMPETISGFLRRCDQTRVSYLPDPEGWPAAAFNRTIKSSDHPATGGETQTSDQPISGDRVNNLKKQSSVALTAISKNGESGPSPSLDDQQGLKTDA